MPLIKKDNNNKKNPNILSACSIFWKYCVLCEYACLSLKMTFPPFSHGSLIFACLLKSELKTFRQYLFIDTVSLEIATLSLFPALHIAKDVRATRVKMTQVLQFPNARLYSNLLLSLMKWEKKDKIVLSLMKWEKKDKIVSHSWSFRVFNLKEFILRFLPFLLFKHHTCLSFL